MRRLKKLFALLTLTVVMAALGMAGGLALRSVFAQEPVQPSCEQDECEGGKRCKDNGGSNTNCTFTGGSCKTGTC